MSAFATFGCAKTPSSNVKTDGIYATFEAKGYAGKTVEVHSTFQVGGPLGTNIELVGSDTITCNGQTLTRQDAGTFISYYYNFPYAAGSTYEFILSRSGEAPKVARVTLPEPVLLISPLNRNTYKSGYPINLSWTPGTSSSDVLHIEFQNGGSPRDIYEDLPTDSGSFTIPAENTQIKSTSYDATLSLKRRRAGSFPNGLTGGIVQATEVSEISINLMK